MNFELALKAMREGKEARYEDDIYFFDGCDLRCYPNGDRCDDYLATLDGICLLSEYWEIVDHKITETSYKELLKKAKKAILKHCPRDNYQSEVLEEINLFLGESEED